MSKAALTLARLPGTSSWLKSLTFVTCLLLEGTAWGHGEADWISAGNYKDRAGAEIQVAHGDAMWIAQDPRTSYCCGISDCERTPLSAVTPIPGGWYLPSTGQRFMEGDADLHMSKDTDFWWCRPPSMGGKVKCLFTPAGGA